MKTWLVVILEILKCVVALIGLYLGSTAVQKVSKLQLHFGVADTQLATPGVSLPERQ